MFQVCEVFIHLIQVWLVLLGWWSIYKKLILLKISYYDVLLLISVQYYCFWKFLSLLDFYGQQWVRLPFTFITIIPIDIKLASWYNFWRVYRVIKHVSVPINTSASVIASKFCRATFLFLMLWKFIWRIRIDSLLSLLFIMLLFCIGDDEASGLLMVDKLSLKLLCPSSSRFIFILIWVGVSSKACKR